ncbi:MAG: hypothetical protein R3268_05760 [Acidiferrobacterales bacterium]|nr:hypothetical protein [Acidiferrobacterales bacterium]
MHTQRSLAMVGDVSGVEVRLLFCRWPRDWQVGATWLGLVREVLLHCVPH